MNKVSWFCYLENGWTDGELAQEWIEKDFDATTKEKANGWTWILVMDGHSSHYTLDLLHYAQEHNIIVIGYPPIYSRDLMWSALQKWRLSFGKRLRYLRTYTLQMCTRNTLLVSLHRHIFQLSPLKPLKLLLQLLDCIHSTPMPSWKSRWSLAYWPPQRAPSQPSPVQAIVVAMGSWPLVAFDLSPSHLVFTSGNAYSPVTPSHCPLPLCDPLTPL